MPESINPFEKTVPSEQPREQENVSPEPEKKPVPEVVNDLLRKINEAEKEEREHQERIDEIRKHRTIQ